MKLRVKPSFRRAINDIRRTFGKEDNGIKDIAKRALRSYHKQPFEYSKPHDKAEDNPTTINLDFRTDEMNDFADGLESNEFMGIVIAYRDIVIEKSKKIQRPRITTEEVASAKR